MLYYNLTFSFFPLYKHLRHCTHDITPKRVCTSTMGNTRNLQVQATSHMQYIRSYCNLKAVYYIIKSRDNPCAIKMKLAYVKSWMLCCSYLSIYLLFRVPWRQSTIESKQITLYTISMELNSLHGVAGYSSVLRIAEISKILCRLLIQLKKFKIWCADICILIIYKCDRLIRDSNFSVVGSSNRSIII